ncbi:MAG: type II toxin-antitoxin system ParD family antitoxin [Alphaproteobacteria bacterium]|nr:type II toxin-antitoxin system ParD family antitoxin [Alphaproteobacteria bacterium]
MATMNISLPGKMKKRVQAQIERGIFANASDYVRSLIRQDIERQSALADELKKGEASGISRRRVPEILAAAKRAKSRKNG